jgi:molecular chaperone GrpE
MRKSHDRHARDGARDAAKDPSVTPDGAPTDAEVPVGPVDTPTSIAADADVGTAAGDDVATLRSELEAQRDKYLRLAAEFDNFRRRSQKERAEAGTRGQAELVRSMLDALDDLDRFAQVDPATTTAQSLAEAVTLVGRKLTKTLTAAGLEVVNPIDETFDPARHEALATAPAASPEDDSTVAQVYQLGYVFGGQLLRPARVVVRQWNG